jgi:hypothetical protein
MKKMNFSIFGLQTKVYKTGRTEHSQGKKEKDIKAGGVLEGFVGKDWLGFLGKLS